MIEIIPNTTPTFEISLKGNAPLSTFAKIEVIISQSLYKISKIYPDDCANVDDMTFTFDLTAGETSGLFTSNLADLQIFATTDSGKTVASDVYNITVKTSLKRGKC